MAINKIRKAREAKLAVLLRRIERLLVPKKKKGQDQEDEDNDEGAPYADPFDLKVGGVEMVRGYKIMAQIAALGIEAGKIKIILDRNERRREKEAAKLLDSVVIGANEGCFNGQGLETIAVPDLVPAQETPIQSAIAASDLPTPQEEPISTPPAGSDSAEGVIIGEGCCDGCAVHSRPVKDGLLVMTPHTIGVVRVQPGPSPVEPPQEVKETEAPGSTITPDDLLDTIRGRRGRGLPPLVEEAPVNMGTVNADGSTMGSGFQGAVPTPVPAEAPKPAADTSGENLIANCVQQGPDTEEDSRGGGHD